LRIENNAKNGIIGHTNYMNSQAKKNRSTVCNYIGLKGQSAWFSSLHQNNISGVKIARP
jgi:hypothetical protein